MKCIIPGVNIKVFGRAIHSLSKIGEELYFEPLEHGLALRTVNSARSAYACFLFAPAFFQLYDDGIPEVSSQDSDDENLRCKVGMKSCLSIFKSMSTIEKTVERCKIKMNVQEARLVIQLHCKHGIVKTHNLAFIECETLQAVFSKDMCVNKLTAPARLLADAVVNFQSNQEEITLIATPEKITLKNYVDDEPDPNKVMHTMLNLDPSEFDNCQFGVDTEITFCLKELRAILAFAEVTGMPLSLQFETAGRPVVFCIDSDSAFEANFVLATLADQPSSQVPSSQRPTTRTTGSTSVKRQSTAKPTCQSNKNSTSVSSRTESRGDEMGYEGMMDDDFDDDMIVNDVTVYVPGKSNHSVTAAGDSRKRDRESPQPSTSSSAHSPIIPNQAKHKPTSRAILPDISVNEDMNYDEEEDEDEDDCVPGTPPNKKFRSLFFGMSQSSTQVSESQKDHHNSMVLAEDTDEED